VEEITTYRKKSKDHVDKSDEDRWLKTTWNCKLHGKGRRKIRC
jgi:hypothetical protein